MTDIPINFYTYRDYASRENKDHQGRTMTSSMMKDVAAFGGIAPPPLSVRASDPCSAKRGCYADGKGHAER
jgi:hypothetical protein